MYLYIEPPKMVLLEESSEKQLLKAPCWWLKAIFDIKLNSFFSKTTRLAYWLTHLHNLKSFSSSLPTWRNSTTSPFEDLQLFIWNIFGWYSETWISLKEPRNSPILNYENPKALRHVSWGLKVLRPSHEGPVGIFLLATKTDPLRMRTLRR